MLEMRYIKGTYRNNTIIPNTEEKKEERSEILKDATDLMHSQNSFTLGNNHEINNDNVLEVSNQRVNIIFLK